MSFLKQINFDFIDFLPFAERPCRAKFIPSKAWDDLDSYRNDSKGLKNYCKKWRTLVRFAPNKSKAKIYKKYIPISGEYWERQNTIIIHNMNFDSFVFTDETWDRFKYKFLQTLMHEFIHFMQYDRRFEEPSYCYYPYARTRSAAKNEDRKYYSNFDEVQAYAHCIWLDIKMKCPTEEVSTLITKDRVPSSTLTSIFKTFDYDTSNNEVFNKIYREVIRWDNRYQKQFKTS